MLHSFTFIDFWEKNIWQGYHVLIISLQIHQLRTQNSTRDLSTGDVWANPTVAAITVAPLGSSNITARSPK